jgi:hypothetical protein
MLVCFFYFPLGFCFFFLGSNCLNAKTTHKIWKETPFQANNSDYTCERLQKDNNLPSFVEAENTKISLLSYGILDVLPDIEDRLLICDAIIYKCDCFCTRDWKTILRNRSHLKSLPVDIITPTEWWDMIEPYARLWV